jgi:hypothetical protein
MIASEEGRPIKCVMNDEAVRGMGGTRDVGRKKVSCGLRASKSGNGGGWETRDIEDNGWAIATCPGKEDER